MALRVQSSTLPKNEITICSPELPTETVIDVKIDAETIKVASTNKCDISALKCTLREIVHIIESALASSVYPKCREIEQLACLVETECIRVDSKWGRTSGETPRKYMEEEMSYAQSYATKEHKIIKAVCKESSAQEYCQTCIQPCEMELCICTRELRERYTVIVEGEPSVCRVCKRFIVYKPEYKCYYIDLTIACITPQRCPKRDLTKLCYKYVEPIHVYGGSERGFSQQAYHQYQFTGAEVREMPRSASYYSEVYDLIEEYHPSSVISQQRSVFASILQTGLLAKIAFSEYGIGIKSHHAKLPKITKIYEQSRNIDFMKYALSSMYMKDMHTSLPEISILQQIDYGYAQEKVMSSQGSDYFGIQGSRYSELMRPLREYPRASFSAGYLPHVLPKPELKSVSKKLQKKSENDDELEEESETGEVEVKEGMSMTSIVVIVVTIITVVIVSGICAYYFLV